MMNIARIEWLKIKNYPAFWWVMGITTLTYPGINYFFQYVFNKELANDNNGKGQIIKALLGNPFSFPEAWRTVAFFSSLFVFVPAIVVILLITNEYNFKTNRQNIIDGWSRNEFMTGKLIDVVILSAIVTVLYAVVAFTVGMGNSVNPGKTRFALAYYIGLFGLQMFSQLSLAFVAGFLIRKSFIALAVFIFYYIIAEPYLAKYLFTKYWTTPIGEFFPLQISHRLIPNVLFGRFNEESYKADLKAINPHIFYTIVLLLITWGFCFWLNKKRDL